MADPEKGRIRSRGSISEGIPIALRIGASAEDTASVAPEARSIEIEVRSITMVGKIETDADRPLFAPSMKEGKRSLFFENKRRPQMRSISGTVRDEKVRKIILMPLRRSCKV